MAILKKYICEDCSWTDSINMMDKSNIESHINNNPTHIVVEKYIYESD